MIALSLFSIFLACGDKSNDTSSIEDTASISGETYSFEGMQFVFQSGEGFELVGDSFSIDFTQDPREMRFGAGCNTHGGEYEVVDGVFEMAGMYATEMGCEMELMDQDSWLATFFMSSPSVVHDGDTITFTGSDATLVFIDEEVAIPDLQLTDITWEIDSYFDGEVATTYNLDVSPSLYFASDGTMTANLGCNGASGTYTEDSGSLTITLDTITEAFCEGDLNTVEGHIYNVISNTPTYEIDGNSITLIAGEKGIGASAVAE